jgi:dihydrofolate reductase
VRKLRVFESISVDGYFTDANGDISWTHAGRNDAEFADWVGAMMEAYWPTDLAAKQMPVVAKGMNAAKKYVASRTIQPTWNNTRLLEGDLVQSVRTVKASEGPDITVLGSGSIAAQLGEAWLVDSYQFVIVPIALGRGRTVFTQPRKLRLVDHRAFRCGNVVVTYEYSK